MQEIWTRLIKPRLWPLALVVGMLGWGIPAGAEPGPAIGQVVVVRNQVQVTHPEAGGEWALVESGNSVVFLDTYETQAAARLKLLFEDDSILNLGENTRLQITENIYAPEDDHRSTVVELFSGRVRALVGRHFSSDGSRFEIHSATAVAAARGTYFIVWQQEDATGVANVGEDSEVLVSNRDEKISGTVTLKPGQVTTVSPGMPPLPATSIGLAQVNALVSSTEAADEPEQEAPSELDSPGADAAADTFQAVVDTPVSMTKVGGAVAVDVEVEVPSLPPIPQQPPADTIGVSIQLQF